MSVVSRLTVTPLLYACGGLALLSIALGVALALSAGKVDTARADVRAAQADVRAVTTERDAWKVNADAAKGANAAYGVAFTAVQAELVRSQGEAQRLSEAGRVAIEAAQADAAAAGRALKTYADKYQTESTRPKCAQALAAMAAACPALEGY